MKKVAFFVFSVVIFVGVVLSSFFIGDKIAPEIKLKETPKISCDCKIDDLIDYASAKDNNLKSFFIENTNIDDIVKSKRITFVAIDDRNNISKLNTNVEISSEYYEFHIENKKELKIQKGTEFNINDYFEVLNGCNFKVFDILNYSDFNTDNIGIYELEVTSNINKTEPLITNIEVIDEFAPKINLNKNEIRYYTNSNWSDNDFINIIETLEDDKDTREDLIKNMDINWRQAMHADINGLVTNPGDYEVTYTVNDSDGNKTETKVVVHLENVINNIEESENQGG